MISRIRRCYWFLRVLYKPYHFTDAGQLKMIEPELAWAVAGLVVACGPAFAALTRDPELQADAEAWRRIFIT